MPSLKKLKLEIIYVPVYCYLSNCKHLIKMVMVWAPNIWLRDNSFWLFSKPDKSLVGSESVLQLEICIRSSFILVPRAPKTLVIS